MKKNNELEPLINRDEVVIDIPTNVDPETGQSVYNNWTKLNTDTVRNWKTTVAMTSFVYQTTLEKYKKKLDAFLIVALIFSTLNTIISAVSSALLSINDIRFVWVTFGLNVLMFALNGIITVTNGSVKIFKWDEFVTNISTFIEKLDVFYSDVSSQLVLPDRLRGNAVPFIEDVLRDLVWRRSSAGLITKEE